MRSVSRRTRKSQLGAAQPGDSRRGIRSAWSKALGKYTSAESEEPSEQATCDWKQ
jgi:hypothetical protein